MKIRELLDLIEIVKATDPDFLECEAVIRLDNPSIGGSAATKILGVHAGFDWDKGRVFFETTDTIMSLPPCAPGKRAYEDVQVSGINSQDKAGTSLCLVHRGGYVGSHLRTQFETGDRIRIIKLSKPVAKPQPATPNA